MNIPTIEELDRIGCEAAGSLPTDPDQWFRKYATAIRDAVVAACKPQLRPIAEMPAKVPEGCMRMFVGPGTSGPYGLTRDKCPGDTHYIDIALPPSYPEDFEQAFTESKFDAKNKAAAFRLWKGGAR